MVIPMILLMGILRGSAGCYSDGFSDDSPDGYPDDSPDEFCLVLF